MKHTIHHVLAALIFAGTAAAGCYSVSDTGEEVGVSEAALQIYPNPVALYNPSTGEPGAINYPALATELPNGVPILSYAIEEHSPVYALARKVPYSSGWRTLYNVLVPLNGKLWAVHNEGSFRLDACNVCYPGIGLAKDCDWEYSGSGLRTCQCPDRDENGNDTNDCVTGEVNAGADWIFDIEPLDP